MRRALLATLALSALACPPAASAGARPLPTGFWESKPLVEGGEAANILVTRTRGRTLVSRISTPTPDCRTLLTTVDERPGPRLRLDRRGGFATRPDTLGGLRSLRGRLRGGRRPAATLHATWRSGPCRVQWNFTLRPVSRVRLPRGAWTGTHAAGGAFSFDVIDAGRKAFGIELTPSPLLRCMDGSAGQIANYRLFTEPAWIRPDGGFALRAFVDNGRLFTISGTFAGEQATGTFRIIEPHQDARGICDTGEVAFGATRQG